MRRTGKVHKGGAGRQPERIRRAARGAAGKPAIAQK